MFEREKGVIVRKMLQNEIKISKKQISTSIMINEHLKWYLILKKRK